MQLPKVTSHKESSQMARLRYKWLEDAHIHVFLALPRLCGQRRGVRCVRIPAHKCRVQGEPATRTFGYCEEGMHEIVLGSVQIFQTALQGCDPLMYGGHRAATLLPSKRVVFLTLSASGFRRSVNSISRYHLIMVRHKKIS